MARTAFLLPLVLSTACAAALATNVDPRQLVGQRRAEMTQMSSEMQGLGRAISSAAPDAAAVAGHAARIAALAANIEQLFPQGSGPDAGPATHARDRIWREPLQFQTQAHGLLDAARALENAAETGDLRDLRSQAMAIDAVCVGCHRDFRDQ